MWVLSGIGHPAAAITDAGSTAYTTAYDPHGTENVTAGGDSAQWKQNPFGFKGPRDSATQLSTMVSSCS